MSASQSSKFTVLLIGSGQLAQHLRAWVAYKSFNETRFLFWDRHQDPLLLEKFVLQSTHVWLALKDDAIFSFYQQHLAGHDLTTVHFSGALHLPPLISAHPLMTFSKTIYTESFYDQIQFAVTGASSLDEVLPEFTNSFFILPAEKKPLYHALCVIAGNFPQLLWNEVWITSELNSIPTEGFTLFIQKSLENFLDLKEQALTGPLIRKDFATIQTHQNALSDSVLKNIYQTFQKEFAK